MNKYDHEISQLKRKVSGLQTQVTTLNALQEQHKKETDMRLRNLEIKTAVQKGLSQRKVAEIYNISAGRVNQILKVV